MGEAYVICACIRDLEKVHFLSYSPNPLAKGKVTPAHLHLRGAPIKHLIQIRWVVSS